MRLFFILFVLLFGSQAHAVTKEEMLSLVESIGKEVSQSGNTISYTYRGIPETIVFDENANRMRIVSGITQVQNVDDAMLLNALEANYHSVLDARYAVSDDILWSVFIHPLSDLSLPLLTSAIQQVAIAHATFGNEFTSGTLIFPGSNQ